MDPPLKDRCDVPINDVEAVEMLKSTEELRGVEPGSIYIETAFSLEVVE